MLAVALAALAAQDVSSTKTRPEPVRLVVMVSVDQMTPEQLERLAPWLHGGLGRFAHSGRVFPRSALRYGDTETGPGHAAYGTGCLPRTNGIISNDWFAPDSRDSAYCFGDRDARALTNAGVGEARASSPRNLRRDGAADRFEANSREALTLGISSKDRSAIGMTGRKADLALWWDKKLGGFQSSSWYGTELPEWVRARNVGWQERLPFAGGWNAELPGNFEGSGTAPDEREGEPGKPGQRSFPHGVPPRGAELDEKGLARLASWVYDGPAGDVMVCDMALAALEALPFGQDDVPDLLALSLSSCDTVGHAFGPTSVEVTDVLLRADRELGRVFDALDARVGKGRWIASLSADHGVLELPETLAARGYASRRLSGKEIGETFTAARNAAVQRFGQDFCLATNWRGLRLSPSAMAAAKVEPREVRAFYAEALRANGGTWLAHAVTWDELKAIARDGAPARDGLIAMEANSFDEERSSDVVTLQKPWCLPGNAYGTTHGTPYDYDRKIPLVFVGGTIEPGRDFREASSIDALPTLLELAGLPVPEGVDGRVLLTR